MTGQPVEFDLAADRMESPPGPALAAWACTSQRRSGCAAPEIAAVTVAVRRSVHDQRADRRRWEAGLSALTTHQQFFLKLFTGYIERNGVREFRRRFVAKTPR